MARNLLKAVGTVALLGASPALADSTIHGLGTATTIPIPTLSCIEVDQSATTDTKLCPINSAGWAAAFGFSSLATTTFPSIANLLGSSGSAFTSITVGSGLSLSGGTLTATGGGGGTAGYFLATAQATNVANAFTLPATGWTNTQQYIVCGYFPAANAGGSAVTLAVGGQAALPVKLQSAGGLLDLGGGEIGVGNHCLQLNQGTPPTAFLLDGPLPAGPALLNPASPTALTFYAWWVSQQQITYTSDPGLTLQAANTLPSGGGLFIQTIGTLLTITPAAGDAINNGQVGGGAVGIPIKFPSDHEAVMTSSGATGVTAFRVPLGPIQYDGFSWLPGMDLSVATTGIRGTRVGTPRVVYNIKCENDLLAGAAKTLTFKTQAANGTIAAGTTFGTTTFDMNANLAVEQTISLTPAPYILLADYYWGALVTGTIGTGTSGGGRCTMAFR